MECRYLLQTDKTGGGPELTGFWILCGGLPAYERESRPRQHGDFRSLLFLTERPFMERLILFLS